MMREQILELLRTDPEFREEVRRLILTEDLLALPSKVDQLTEVVRELVDTVRELAAVQRQQAEQIRALTEAQQRTEEQLQRQGEQIRALTEAQQRTEERLNALAEAQRRTEERLNALAEAQRRTEEQLQRQGEQIRALTEAQQRTEERLNALAEAQRRTEEALQWLINWQRGEMGRREGERYERHIIRQAPILFNGGEGGSPADYLIQKRLTELLPRQLREQLFQDDESNPFLADLIWWKDERVAVVEISLQVDGYDVIRAKQRAKILSEAGVQVIGVVIGKEWANVDAYDAAVRHEVEWLVGREMSDGLKEFRKI